MDSSGQGEFRHGLLGRDLRLDPRHAAAATAAGAGVDWFARLSNHSFRSAEREERKNSVRPLEKRPPPQR